MAFRTSNQRDDRRRRMMTAETEQPMAAVRSRGATGGRAAADDKASDQPGYTNSALPENQPRVVDYVPLRLWKVFVLLGLLAICVTSMVTVPTWLPPHVASKIAGTALDLAAPIGLATWLSSFMLLAGSVLAMVVYGVRSHKIDDYRGRYRVWRQAAVGWLVLSIGVGANLAPTIESLMSSLTGGALAGNVALWWAIPAAMIVGYIAPALLADMHRCRMGSSLLLMAVGSWAFAVASMLGWLPLEASQRVMIESSALLIGHSLLLSSMVLYARYVLRESQGLIVPRQRRAKAEQKPEGDADQDVAEVDNAKPQKTKRRLLSLRRGKKARIEPSHTEEEQKRKPHVAIKKKTVRHEVDAIEAEESYDDRPSRSAVATKPVKKKLKASKPQPQHVDIEEDSDDPIAIEVARLEGLGSRLSKSQRKKLRKLRRQMAA